MEVFYLIIALPLFLAALALLAAAVPWWAWFVIVPFGVLWVRDMIKEGEKLNASREAGDRRTDARKN